MDYSEKLEKIMNGSYYRNISTECEETDDVFSCEGAAVDNPDPFVVALRREQNQMDLGERRNCCSKRWSISHRCFDCDWNAARDGRPLHPAKASIAPLSSDAPTLVTLQSLGQTRDSGYEPSPTSASSFSFSSDEETEQELEATLKAGISPPIDIPNPSGHRKRVESSKKRSEFSTVETPEVRIELMEPPKEVNAELLRNLVGKGYSIRDKVLWSPRGDKGNMRRVKSVPDLSSLPPFPRTPNVQRGAENWSLSTPAAAPCHGRNYSCPATTADGKALLSSACGTPASRASREGLIDLAEEDPEGAYGHKRRVLVLALPDLVTDTGNVIDPVSSSNSISGASSNSSGVDCDTLGPVSRPAWRRPRALSCDVTMEVEVGKDLRRIAYDFNRTASSSGSLWTTFTTAIRRRLSIASTISEGFQTPPESLTEYAQFDVSTDGPFF